MKPANVNEDDDRAAEARARLLERELFRVHQLQLEGSTPAATAPPSCDDLPPAAVEQRWAQLVEQNSRLGAYQVHLQGRLDKLEGALAETRQKLGQDPLTGLLSGGELARRLQEAIEASRASREAVGLILVEVDHTYLDRCLGAQRGYWLMRQAAQRLSASLVPGSSDALGRWGDSQFLAIVHAPASDKADLAERISSLARRWTQSLEKPVDFGGIPLTMTAFAGALLVDGEDAATALERVRRALTQARNSAVNSFHVYSEELREKSRRLAALQPALTQARSQGQLQIFYQPIIAAGGPAMRVAGLETRLRWMHPQGVVEARQFVEVLEESGEILAIDEWVLEEACRQLAGVPDVERVTLAVNLTPGHLLVADLPRRIFNLVEKSGLAPQRLCVELSEVCLVQAPEQTGSLARELSRLGISMSIDGFGSRLSSLAGLPVRFLKLDANLVSQLDQPECQKMCKGALGLAHQMGIEVIAKRVETPQQVAWLRQAGCDYLQGYFFSAPVPLEEVSALAQRTWS